MLTGAALAVVLLFGMTVLCAALEFTSDITPAAEKADIREILEKEVPEEQDYRLLFSQTGLGKPALRRLWNTEEGKQEILDHQERYYQKKYIQCQRVGIITKEERTVDREGNPIAGFQMADVRQGDVLITTSTHSLGWRHGHCAIVVGTEPLRTLEAEALGTRSRLIENPAWTRYPTFIQLRLKEEFGGAAAAQQASEYGRDCLTGLPYGFLCRKGQVCSQVHCSFLVWQTYRQAGVDVDANGGFFVTPKEIYQSDCFEIVQIFGMKAPELDGFPQNTRDLP